MTRGLENPLPQLDSKAEDAQGKLMELRQKLRDPASIIFERLQAEKALRELGREEANFRIARNVRTVWRERNFLVRLSLLGLALGLLVAFLIPARFTSITRLMPPDNQAGSALASAATSMAGARGGEIAGGLLGIKSSSDVFVGILTTRAVQDHIIEQFDLRRVYGLTHMEDARLNLASCTTIAVDRKSQIITIAVTDRRPERAQSIANAYVDQLNRLVSELSTSSARRERIFLESRLAQVNQDLEIAEKEFSQFASKNAVIDIKEQGRAMLDASATLQGRLMFAQSELQGLREIYSDSNVRVRSVKARIAELQLQLEKFGGKDRTDTRVPDTTTPDLYPSIRKLPLLGVTYADLYRRTKVQEAVYEVLTQEYELSKVQEAKEIPMVKVVDPADLPDKKTFPPRMLIGLSSMFSSFLGGVFFLLAVKIWHEKDPRDISKATVTEIWTDLKEKRLLNSANGVSHETETVPCSSLHRKRSIFSLLGWKNVAHNHNGHGSDKEPYNK